MNNSIFLIIFPILIMGFLPVFSESYNLKIDEHSYDIQYDIDADVLAMAIDQELNSLLIGLKNANDSLLTIHLSNEMISAENNEFAILVDGLEVNYEINSNEDSIQMTFFVPTGTQEIEIIGTHVIPEFPTVLLVLLLMISGVVIITKRPILSIR